MDQFSYNFVKKIVQLPFVDEVWLFGSRARGDSKARSDIDLAIICPQATDEDWRRVLDIVDNSDTLLNIDCIRFDDIRENDTFKSNILRDKKVLYSKGDSFVDKSLWKDYFGHLGNALARLKEVLDDPDLPNKEALQDAVIHCIELYWKVLKKFLAYEKIDTTTPRDVLQKAYQYKLIDDERQWLSMMDDRNNTSHCYNQEEATRVFQHIKSNFPVMERTYIELKKRFEG